jgi:hypothetical protein
LPEDKVEEVEMDNFLDRDESQPWGICQHNPQHNPSILLCHHCQTVFGQNPAFQEKQNFRMVKVSGSRSLSLLRQPIPPEVFEQLDKLLEEAVQAMAEDKETPILSPSMWDAILILRNTDMRLSELEFLKAYSQANHPGCLEQDANGFWWLHIPGPKRILGQNDRILIPTCSGVVEAIHRQEQRIVDTPDPLGNHCLFCGSAMTIALPRALRKLAAHLTYNGQPYVICSHQFRSTNVFNTIACFLHHVPPLPTTIPYLYYHRPSLDR